MINKMKSRQLQISLETIFVILGTIFYLFFIVGYNVIDFGIPIRFDNDAITGITAVKQLFQEGEPNMGWPLMQDTSDYGAMYTALYRIYMFFGGVFTHNPVLLQNVLTICIQVFNVLVCYFVFRTLLKSKWLAFLTSMMFGMCPYVQWRVTLHGFLASVECIPLVFLLILWLYEDSMFNHPGKDWVRNKRNWLALFFSWMIANNGMVYYPFFSCFIILIAVIYIGFREHSWKAVLPGLITIGEIAGWLAVGFIPTVVGMIKGVGNTATNGANRDAFRATVYGLDIKSMFLSPNGFGIQKLKDAYNLLTNFSNENQYSYLGVVGIIGFIILIIFLFIGQKQKQTQCMKRIDLLSKLTVAMVLLAVTNGFGVLVAVFVPYISCYNRISPFILFASLLTVGFLIDEYLPKITADWKRYTITGILAIVLILSLLEQSNVYLHFEPGCQDEIKEEYLSDKDFFEEVENSVEENTMVFMLPYMRSFENGPVGKIRDYDHCKGYLFTNTLRWSYGAANGSQNDEWYQYTSQLSPDRLVLELIQQGFGGIYINLDGYEKEKGTELLGRLRLAANCETVIWNQSQTKAFISLSNYRVIEAGYSWFLTNYSQDNEQIGYEEANQLALGFNMLDPYACQKVYDIINCRASDDEEYIQLLYETLLHRECSEEEIHNWIESLNSDRYSVFWGFITSEEFIERGL